MGPLRGFIGAAWGEGHLQRVFLTDLVYCPASVQRLMGYHGQYRWGAVRDDERYTLSRYVTGP